MAEVKVRHCPQCQAVLTRKYPRRMIFECPNGHGPYKVVIKRQRWTHKNPKFDPNDSTTWRARCAECGGSMEYYNFKYHCDCGNVLYV